MFKKVFYIFLFKSWEVNTCARERVIEYPGLIEVINSSYFNTFLNKLKGYFRTC